MIELIHKTQIRVRYAETDMMGFVWNGIYNQYFEIGRTELMRQFGLRYREMEDNGIQLPLTECNARYIQPAFYDDVLEIEAKLVYEGGARLKFDYNILRDNSTITIGYTIHSFMNSITKRPVKPPKMFIELLNRLENK